jgi:hypothetical protein
VALTITLANAIRTVLRKTGLGLYAPNAEITIPSTTTFTWASLFANINLSTHSFEGWLVWRPDSATAGGVDDVRYISSINWTTGVVTVDRAWTDATVGTEDIYILRPPLRPQRSTSRTRNHSPSRSMPASSPVPRQHGPR